jgi:hypothetical protein
MTRLAIDLIRNKELMVSIYPTGLSIGIYTSPVSPHPRPFSPALPVEKGAKVSCVDTNAMIRHFTTAPLPRDNPSRH